MACNGELFDIFSRLPAKSILKLASVSKSCNEYSSEDYFIKKQSGNMVQKGDSTFFMQRDSYEKYVGKPEFHVLPGEKNSSGVPNQSLDFLKKYGHLLGSSNGLVCCRNISENLIEENHLFICNPTTQRWLSIPDPQMNPKYELKIVFQCNINPSDEFPNDYFLMAMEPYTEHWSSNLMCKIYLPTEGIWQDRWLINGGPRDVLLKSVIYQKGVCYLLSDCVPYSNKENRPYIVELDPQKSTSTFLQIPKVARKHEFFRNSNLNMGIFKWGQGNEESICLVVLSKGVFTVWALRRNNSASTSWRKILKVRTRAMWMVESNPQIAGFTVINGSSLLVATEKRVYRCNLTGDWRWKKAEKVCSNKCGPNVSFYPYSNTLRPCGDGATPIPTYFRDQAPKAASEHNFDHLNM